MEQNKKNEQPIQEAAKQKVVDLFANYDVSYIDYDAREDDYSIRLVRKQS